MLVVLTFFYFEKGIPHTMHIEVAYMYWVDILICISIFQSSYTHKPILIQSDMQLEIAYFNFEYNLTQFSAICISEFHKHILNSNAN
jgi:hypothetical protein